MNKKQTDAVDRITEIISDEEGASAKTMTPDEWREVLEAIIEECQSREEHA